MTKSYIPASCDGRSPLRRVAAIHDISCFGRCALTVILPTLSAMGLQAVPVPTCLLSSHTGGFTELYFEDCTPSMSEIADHFERLGLKFDAIYTGFLGNDSQIALVGDFIRRFSDERTLVLVDPVMGDGGELYSTYTPKLMRGMSALCRHAHVITPNLTEACFLTDTPYADTSGMSERELSSFAKELCEQLAQTGAEKTVLTGLHAGADKLCVCGRDNGSGEYFEYIFPRVDRNYPGTGDLFASVVLGELMRGATLEGASRSASDFVRRVMEYSSHFPTPEREGVAFEAFLGELAEKGTRYGTEKIYQK